MTLADSGPLDPVAGNGSYLAEVPSLTPGRYRAILTASGTVPATGNSFQRQASTEFSVLAAAGTISSAQSQLVDTNSNGLFDLLRVTFPVSIPVPGQYELSAELAAPNGRVFQVVTQVDLGSGQQAVVADVPARDLFALAADGPLSIRNVFLEALLDERVNHQSAANLGSTVPYVRSALDLGVAHIAGLVSAVGVDSNGVPGFEFLRARLSVNSQTADCSWRAELAAQDGTRLGFASSSGRLTAGSNTVDLDFDGGEIRRVNKDGPYRLVRTSIECSGTDPFQAGELATGPFTASQFENVSVGFSLTGEVSAVSITPGRYAAVVFQLSKTGTFQEPIAISITGLPSSVVASALDGPVWAPAAIVIDLAATAAAVPGSYPLTVTASGGGLTRTLPLTLTVSSALIAVRVTPSNITMNRNEAQQFSALVIGAPTTAVVWAVEPAVGTITSTGLYTAPANIAAAQPINVVARSVHDATKVAYARVNLTASPVAISLDPPSAVMLPGQTLALTAVIQNTPIRA